MFEMKSPDIGSGDLFRLQDVRLRRSIIDFRPFVLFILNSNM